jgi:hypothetical protein
VGFVCECKPDVFSILVEALEIGNRDTADNLSEPWPLKNDEFYWSEPLDILEFKLKLRKYYELQKASMLDNILLQNFDTP